MEGDTTGRLFVYILGACLILENFENYSTKSHRIFGLFSPRKKLYIIFFYKKWVWLHFTNSKSGRNGKMLNKIQARFRQKEIKQFHHCRKTLRYSLFYFIHFSLVDHTEKLDT
jgi:hypothetical protein